jgi:hypothetical protein
MLLHEISTLLVYSCSVTVTVTVDVFQGLSYPSSPFLLSLSFHNLLVMRSEFLDFLSDAYLPSRFNSV